MKSKKPTLLFLVFAAAALFALKSVSETDAKTLGPQTAQKPGVLEILLPYRVEPMASKGFKMLHVRDSILRDEEKRLLPYRVWRAEAERDTTAAKTAALK